MYHPQDYHALRNRIIQAIGTEKSNELECILTGLEGLNRLLRINPVSGAPNILKRDEDLAAITERRGEAKNIYVVMMDIDDFGHFNKVYGEQTGDTVLRGITEIINSTLRSDDVVLQLTNDSYGYHLHGEELLAIYTCHNLQEARDVAERIRRNVELRSVEKTGHQVTISLGIASWKPEEESYQKTQHRADRYMQFAKTEGKNLVYCGETDPLFHLKERFYQPGALENLAKRLTNGMKAAKGILGRTATRSYSSCPRALQDIFYAPSQRDQS